MKSGSTLPATIDIEIVQVPLTTPDDEVHPNTLAPKYGSAALMVVVAAATFPVVPLPVKIRRYVPGVSVTVPSEQAFVQRAFAVGMAVPVVGWQRIAPLVLAIAIEYKPAPSAVLEIA